MAFVLPNLHYEKVADGTVKCVEDEIPFELPEGWAWERLGNISTIARGGSPRPIKAFITDDANGINWIKIGDTEKDGKYIFSTKEKIKPEGVVKSRFVKSEDFLLTNSMSFGRPYILKTDGCIHDGWLVIGDIDLVFNQDYLYYALSANYMYQTMAIMAGGSTVDNLNSDLVKSLLFPIPPINEQEAIAHKVSDLLDLVELIKNSEATIVGEISLLKSKILDLAIRGKLVPQNPSDEPASVLLDRMRAEKEELIKQGKIKRDKKESVIFKGEDNSYYEKIGEKVICIDDELPFDVPESWSWARISTIGIINPRNTLSDGTNVSFIPMPLIKDGYSNSHTSEIKTWVDVKSGFTHFAENDVGVAKITPCFENKKSVVFKELCNGFGAGTTELHIIRTFSDGIYPEYLLWCLKTNSFISSGINAFSGAVGQKRIGKDFISDYLIPIPPRKEQDKIIKMINQIFAFILNIEKSLN